MVSAIQRLKLGATFAGGLEVVGRFPLPALCALTFAALLLGDQHNLFDSDDERLLSFLSLGFFAALAGALFGEQRRWTWPLRLVSSALSLAGVAAITFLSRDQTNDVWAVHFMFLMPGLILLTMAAPFLAQTDANDAFWGFNHDAWFGAALGLASALIVALAAMALFAAFDILFGVEVDSDIYGDVWVICLAVLWPWIALYAVPRNFDAPAEAFAPVWLRFVSGILLVPIATIYLVVLYVYGLTILVGWELPRGNVANVACGFAAVGVITHLVSYPWRDQGSRWVRFFYRAFPVLLFVPIALLAIAVVRRVSDYGITEERYFLMLAALWLAAIAIYFSLRGRRLVLIAASLAVLLIAASFGTWGATATSERSQINILRGLLTEAGLLKDGKAAARDDGIDFELRKRISSVLEYLANSGKTAALEPLFADTDVTFAEGARPSAPDLTEALGFDFVGLWEDTASFSFDGPDRTKIEIAGYDLLLERSLWSGLSDETVRMSDGRELTLAYDDDTRVLEVSGDGRNRVRFDLGALAVGLVDGDFGPTEQNRPARLDQAMTLDATDGALRVRLLVTRLWGGLDGGAPVNVAGETLLLIAFGRGGS